MPWNCKAVSDPCWVAACNSARAKADAAGGKKRAEYSWMISPKVKSA